MSLVNREAMPILKAEFDGRVFVPQEAVALPVGTQVDIMLPTPAVTAEADEAAEWAAIRAEIAAAAPAFETADEAMRHSRKRP